MWRTEYRFDQLVYDPPVHSSYSQYCPAVGYRFDTYDSHLPDGFVGQCIDTDSVTRRPVPQCENYDEQQWLGASSAVVCRRLWASKHSRSPARRPHHDDSSSFRRRRRRSRSRDTSESAAAGYSRRQHGRPSVSTYSTEASLRSERRSRHTRHHWSRRRRRYSSSSSISRGRRSSVVSDTSMCACFVIFMWFVCFVFLGISMSGELTNLCTFSVTVCF